MSILPRTCISLTTTSKVVGKGKRDTVLCIPQADLCTKPPSGFPLPHPLAPAPHLPSGSTQSHEDPVVDLGPSRHRKEEQRCVSCCLDPPEGHMGEATSSASQPHSPNCARARASSGKVWPSAESSWKGQNRPSGSLTQEGQGRRASSTQRHL